MKKSVIFGIILIAFLILPFVQASDLISNLKVYEVNHTIEMISGDSSSATIKVDNTAQLQLPEQYASNGYRIPNYAKVGDLRFIVTKAYSNNIWINVTLLIGFEKKFYVNSTLEDYIVTFTADGINHTIEFVSADNEHATIKVDNLDQKEIKEQLSEPYSLTSFSSIPGIKAIVTNAFGGGFAYGATVLIFYEKNFSMGCTENWTCTDWNSCNNGQQTRICTDYNNCGTTSNKPSESQSCGTGTNGNGPSPSPLCSNECNASGDKTCFNSSYYKTCGNYDADSCLEWGSPIICPVGPTGRICDKGECVFPAPIPPNQTKECEQISLRENNKYCDSQYKWKTQKIDSSSCDNNFECKNNLCLEGICGGNKKPLNLAYYFLGAVVIVILIIIIFFIFRRPK